MNKINLIVVFLLATIAAQSQSLTNAGINSISGNYGNTNNSLSYSVGQSIIGTFSSASNGLTNGTLQPTEPTSTAVQGSFPAAQCGYLNNTLSGYIVCNTTIGASGYLVKFYTVGSNIVYAQKTITNTSVTFGGLTPALQGGTQYDVTVTPVMPGGAVGIESTKCRMGLIVTPTPTNITPCNLENCISVQANAPVLQSTGFVKSTAIAQASNYEFRFVNVANPGNLVTGLQTSARVRNLAGLNLLPGATYAVTVRAQVLGVWAASFGSVCYIKIAGSSKDDVSSHDMLDYTEFRIQNSKFKIDLNPNPIVDDATLFISSPKEEKANISIADVAGKIICTHVVPTSTNLQFSVFNLQLSSGVYSLSATLPNGERKTIRVVKR